MAPEVLAAWIGFVGTLIAAWVESVIGKRWLHQERLNDPLQQAKEDIRFLLEVERIQAVKRNPEHPMTALREARRMAKDRGLAWSGKNTKNNVEHVR
ncbi:MAG: hypothetical protein K9L32_04535 [Chromatiaceae bacterium]|nr:hypothetical protein [Chromatiaceae bacterium]MCF8003467.1 hypothetical protein [Chromatiaceae bacterium]